METLQAEIAAQMATISTPVGYWMIRMRAILLSSLLFAWKHKEARWAVGAIVMTRISTIVIFILWANVHLFGIAHLIWWTPLLVYLLKSYQLQEKFRQWSFVRVWHHLLCATITVSLLFDVRDIYLVITGVKAMH